jgi:peptide subunit release factor 1 (eRF1)
VRRHVVRCSACGKVHLAVTSAKVEGQPLEKFRQCSQCGREGAFVPSQLLIDELAFVIPCCVVEEGVSWILQ